MPDVQALQLQGRPRRPGSWALVHDVVGDRHRALRVVLQRPAEPEQVLRRPQIAIQLSMIVEITSWAPDGRLQHARDARPQRAAGDAASTIARTTCSGRACRRSDEPTQQPRRSSPTRYWPWPPMLNRPQRNANATARPVRISGVVSDQRLLQVDRGDRAVVAASSTGRQPVRGRCRRRSPCRS